jgi:hypothetical protein
MLILALGMLHQLLKDPNKSIWSYLWLKSWALSVILAYKAQKALEVAFNPWRDECFFIFSLR